MPTTPSHPPPPPSSVDAALARHLGGPPRTANAAEDLPVAGAGAVPKPNRASSFSTGVPLLDASPLRPGSITDISGPSRVGKTALLHHIVAHALWASDTGRSTSRRRGVAWVDLNGGLDISLLERSLAARMNGSAADCTANVDDCLARLHIFRPTTSAELVCTIHAMEAFIASPKGAGVELLVVDSLGTRHYLDAVGRESDADSVEQALTSVMRNLVRSTALTVFVTKLALYESVPIAGAWHFPGMERPRVPPDFLPVTWAALVARHVVLSHHAGANVAVVMAREKRGTGMVAVGLAAYDVGDVGLVFGPMASAAV